MKSMKLIKNVLHKGALCDIGIEDGKIAAIAPAGKLPYEGCDFGGAKVYPGLIDTHTHGCIGHDTMDKDLAEMSEYYLRNGVTTWYPTTMTVSGEDIIAATKVNLSKIGGANIPGFHLEGPFINVKYKGAQNERFVVAPDMELIEKCDKVKKITVAPEVEGAMEFIAECKRLGIVVSVGHSTCDYEIAKDAFSAGASCLTHTYNCMSPLHHRAPGPIPAGAESGAYAELICDGIHVHPAMVRLLVKLYGSERIVLVSDSVRAAGLEDGVYDLGGLDITVKGGVARTKDGNLAGSTATLLYCVKRAIEFGIPEERAFMMATANPARLMGLDKKGKIEVGCDADIIILDKELNLKAVIVRGEF